MGEESKKKSSQWTKIQKMKGTPPPEPKLTKISPNTPIKEIKQAPPKEPALKLKKSKAEE